MSPSSLSLSTAFFLASIAVAQVSPDLVGTWTTKSGKVITGPGFYDPVNEKIFEPNLTGISYSFTADGYYEEALYRALPNPVTPSCPSAILQFQHGTLTQPPNSTLLVLLPFAPDGRQLLSDPCNHASSIFTRYNRSERFAKYQTYTDPYNNRLRLDLYRWDGTPHVPMWLAARPPEMLPTRVLHPVPTATATATATATPGAGTGAEGRSRVRRAVCAVAEKAREQVVERLTPGKRVVGPRWTMDADTWFWCGLGMTGVGAVLYFSF